MKNSYVIVFLLSVATIFTSCKKEPEAMFSVNSTEVFVNEQIEFTSASTNAYAYEWNFGDGNVSAQLSPKHSYSEPGTYNVVLTVFSKNGKQESSTTKTIKVKMGGVSYNQQFYPFNKALLCHKGNYDGGTSHQWDLYLLSPEYTVFCDEDTCTFVGLGNLVYFGIFTSTSDLPSGEFEYDFSTAPQTFWEFSNLRIGYNTNSMMSEQWVDLDEGTLKISKTSTYTVFEIDAKSNDVAVKGGFEGNYYFCE